LVVWNAKGNPAIMINFSGWLKNSLTQGQIENKNLEADGNVQLE